MKQSKFLISVSLFIAVISVFVSMKQNTPSTPLAVSYSEDEVRLLNPFPIANRTTNEIIAKWKQLKPSFTGDPYLEKPSFAAPYKSGKLNPGYLDDGLKMLNFIRYLTGVPSNIKLDAQYSEQCQNACVLMAAKAVAHMIGKPSDMSAEFYKSADLGLRYSNLRSAGKTINLAQAVKDWTDDSDKSNIGALGHRMGILSYYMSKTGFGHVDSYYACYVKDLNGIYDYEYLPVNIEFMSWPSPGYFPVQMMHKGTAWLLFIHYHVPLSEKSFSDYTLTMKRLNDGTEWKFEESDMTYTKDKKFLSWYINSFIFRPDSSFTCNPGDVYEISLKGLVLTNGEKVEVKYQVKLFSLPE